MHRIASHRIASDQAAWQAAGGHLARRRVLEAHRVLNVMTHVDPVAPER
jgi:hypothetical protein